MIELSLHLIFWDKDILEALIIEKIENDVHIVKYLVNFNQFFWEVGGYFAWRIMSL